MPIYKMVNTDIDQAFSIFDKSVKLKEMPYKEISKSQFIEKFYKQQDTYTLISLVDKQNDTLKGFISGVVVADKHKAYLTMIIVDPIYRKLGIGEALLKAFEKTINETYSSTVSIDIVFFNPVQLEWLIPNTDFHDHPNAPGVDLSSNAYLFFKSNGYKDFAKQNSYYKNIKHYAYPIEIKHIISNLAQNHISITYYDATKHYGFEKLFEDLNNPNWTTEITAASKHNLPILIAQDRGLIIGFTGPLWVQQSLRGYFAGIGVHSSYRGLGIGKVLFSSLCLELKKLGACYMTLFTGENNPARKIYEQEDFIIVKSWANLRKEL